jgi:hypothetical protein
VKLHWASKPRRLATDVKLACELLICCIASSRRSEFQKRFLGDRDTATYGINGPYLGPALRLRRGETMTVQVTNNVPENITMHWHVLIIPGSADGGPHQVIAPGKWWQTQLAIDQPAATLWFHPLILLSCHRLGVRLQKAIAPRNVLHHHFLLASVSQSCDALPRFFVRYFASIALAAFQSEPGGDSMNPRQRSNMICAGRSEAFATNTSRNRFIVPAKSCTR